MRKLAPSAGWCLVGVIELEWFDKCDDIEVIGEGG
jgi:hypothetical protein